MMTVPMDNLFAAPSQELVQRLYNKNIELENKRRKSVRARVPSDPNAWQQMRENYEAIILEDHAFSEQHEIEYALWQLHYRRIEELRAHFSAALASTGNTSPGRKGPARPDRIAKIRSQFKTFLSEATGFYHDLILKIRSKYGLPLGYFSDDPENQTILAKDAKKSAEMKKGLLSCHRCLIYLGDLARYKGLYGEGDSKTRDYTAASSYYMQAASLWPSSGNPHHQLAILASYAGDDLLAIYRYFRSLAVDSPFTTARDNLIIAFEKNRQSHSQLPRDTKTFVKAVPVRMTGKGRGKGEAKVLSKDTKTQVTSNKEITIPDIFKAFCIQFIRLNGILFTRTSLETFAEVFSSVTGDLHELLSSGPEEELNFGSDAAENGLAIVRFVAILIFTAHNVNRDVEGQSYAEILQRSVLLQNAFTAAFEFMGHILKRCIQLQDPSSSFLLPGILVFVEWLACQPDIAAGSDVEEKQAAARSFFWNECISFLNKLMLNSLVSDDKDETCFFNMGRYEEGETANRLALWEDFELRGFLPILPAQLILDFSRKHSIGGDGGNKEKRARVQRIIAAGRALANVVRIDQQGIYFDQKLKKFAIGDEPQMSEDFMLANSDLTMTNGMTPNITMDKELNLGIVQPIAQYVEGEEEDEVIVFKPTVAEKPGAGMDALKWPSYEILEHAENAPKAEWSGYMGSVSAPLNNLSLHSALDFSSRSPVAFPNIVPHHLQPINVSASKWLAEQGDSLANGINNISFAGNGLVPKPDLQGGFSVVQSHAPSLTLPPGNTINGSELSGQTKAAEAEIPSKFDSIMSSGATVDSLMVKPFSALPPNSRKNPVSRPVRHFGPPPGFSHVPSKNFDESIAGSDLKNENSLMDDYSWLDGYQFSSSTNGITHNSINHMTNLTPHLMSSSGSTGTISFPFPGKQAPNVQVSVENQKIRQEYQLQEQLKLYQGQQHQQQLQHGNQQFTPQPEQYQGQSLWAGRFFV
ncbi:protein SMG7-like [Macadamia integrifolia]|uniref:protein SMG7-like n=1 Tax=Macadamia integrifolia TaxID=60698 RepID=UPI001C5341A3|nr:protein SMG7-like [Macadamia integrifolia]XP_042475883.1 protein SMG7-like [Macadamia integrifolia]XP_042475884.1 protein SMG7-like [Macadamia integrifolia]XP_042475885.1 protein SMG7-like [Macadamia integrifolia]